MKKTVLERSFVAILFILVIVIFSFAEKDTQKLFEKINTKSTVDLPEKSINVTAEGPSGFSTPNKFIRN